jgi:hypothetical protein
LIFAQSKFFSGIKQKIPVLCEKNTENFVTFCKNRMNFRNGAQTPKGHLESFFAYVHAGHQLERNHLEPFR